jgi:chromosome segregation ATPase
MKKKIIGFVLAGALVLSGCSIDSTIEKQLSNAITEMNSAEKEYRDAQAKLTELEKSEQNLFNETMELTKEQRDELAIKVTELEEMLGQRLTHLEVEEKSIGKAKESVDELDAIIEQADEDDKKGIKILKTAVTNRYELHSAFVAEYKKLITYQKELYGMLVAEETGLVGLKDKVGEVNAQNKLVQLAVTSFNDATAKVNVLKDDVFTRLQKED